MPQLESRTLKQPLTWMQDLHIVGRVPTGIKDLETTVTWMQDLLIAGSVPTGVKDLETTLDIDARSAHRWQCPNWDQGPWNNTSHRCQICPSLARFQLESRTLKQHLTWMQDLLIVGSVPTGIKDLETTLDIDARSAHRWQCPNWNQGP